MNTKDYLDAFFKGIWWGERAHKCASCVYRKDRSGDVATTIKGLIPSTCKANTKPDKKGNCMVYSPGKFQCDMKANGTS